VANPGATLLKDPGEMFHLTSERPRQGVAYEETADMQNPHGDIGREKRGPRVTIKPFSLWVLVVWGITIFFAGFCSSRYGSNFTGASLSPPNPLQSEPNLQTLQADANPASTVHSAIASANAPSVVQVVIRNMKFNPPTLEVKSGDVVEWKNDDITPHTATSPSFDSASIDPDKSWRHTFTEPGNFPYTCTFHPDMKAIVTVK
jgi:plastocyanin